MRISDWSSDVCSSDLQIGAISNFDPAISILESRGLITPVVDTSTSGGGHMMWPLLIKEPNVFPTPKLRAWRGQVGVFVRWVWSPCSPEEHHRLKARTLSQSYGARPQSADIQAIRHDQF